MKAPTNGGKSYPEIRDKRTKHSVNVVSLFFFLSRRERKRGRKVRGQHGGLVGGLRKTVII